MQGIPLPVAREPHLRRLDHLICEVPDISAALQLFAGKLGFPIAWPIGRFWPHGLTCGVAIGGLNLEFIQPDIDAPTEATITTLVFEPIDIDDAARYYHERGVRMELREKWEGDPELLQRRGFSSADARRPQLICRNLVPLDPLPIGFFLCEYSPSMKERLLPECFPEMSRVTGVVMAAPRIDPGQMQIAELLPIGESPAGPTLSLASGSSAAEVVQIVTERGPLDFEDWPCRFRLV